MLTKLGRDEVLMARHMHKDVFAIFAQGQIQREARSRGGGGGGGGGPLLQKTSSSDLKATATNQFHSSDLEACVMKCCCFCFWFHSVVKFFTLESSL